MTRRVNPNETRKHRKHMAGVVAKGWGIGKKHHDSAPILETVVDNVNKRGFGWIWPILGALMLVGLGIWLEIKY